MTDRELMQQALDALEVEHSAIYGTSQTAKAIKALRARLAQPEPDDGYCQACDGNHCTAKNGCIALDNPKAQPEPEPVAWLEPEWGERICPEVGYEVTITADHPRDLCWIPLYTAPPQREWQGLTDEEVRSLWDDHVVPMFGRKHMNPIVFGRIIEDKLKEKNHG